MSEVFLLLKRDLRLFVSQSKVRFLFSFLLILLLVCINYTSIELNESSNPINFYEFWFEFFRGIQPYELKNTNLFPFDWLTIQFITLYLLGNYIRKDLFHESTFLFVRTTKGHYILFSKYILCLLVTTMYYLVLVSCLFFVWLIAFSGELNSLIDFLPYLFIPYIALIILVSIYYILSLFIATIYAVLTLLALIIVTPFFSSLFLPSEYSMMIRSIDYGTVGGFTFGHLLLYTGAILFLSIIVTLYTLRFIDIIPKTKGGD